MAIMISLHVLEQHDAVLASDWCRPLELVSMCGGMSDSYSFTSCYSGQPENNVKWARVDRIFDSVWMGKTCGELCKHSPYEFVRGTPPKAHTL